MSRENKSMQLKKLLEDDTAVSPVIGVILMVAITVILAAVIGTFVLGLGDQVQDPAPTAQFSTDYDADAGSTSDGLVELTHDGGDQIEAGMMSVKGNGINQSDGTRWHDLPGTAASGSTSTVTAGDGAVIGITQSSGASFRLVWESGDGRSSTLAEWQQ